MHVHVRVAMTNVAVHKVALRYVRSHKVALTYVRAHKDRTDMSSLGRPPGTLACPGVDELATHQVPTVNPKA